MSQVYPDRCDCKVGVSKARCTQYSLSSFYFLSQLPILHRDHFWFSLQPYFSSRFSVKLKTHQGAFSLTFPQALSSSGGGSGLHFFKAPVANSLWPSHHLSIPGVLSPSQSAFLSPGSIPSPLEHFHIPSMKKLETSLKPETFFSYCPYCPTTYQSPPRMVYSECLHCSTFLSLNNPLQRTLNSRSLWNLKFSLSFPSLLVTVPVSHHPRGLPHPCHELWCLPLQVFDVLYSRFLPTSHFLSPWLA